MAQPAALLLLVASAHGQAQLRPAIPLPSRAPPAQSVPVAKPAVSPPPAVSRPAAAPRTSPWACQIRAGTFNQRANADNLAKALKPLGEVRVNTMQLGGKPVHLVTLIGLRNRKNAELSLARLKSSGHDLGALSISGCRT